MDTRLEKGIFLKESLNQSHLRLINCEHVDFKGWRSEKVKYVHCQRRICSATTRSKEADLDDIHTDVIVQYDSLLC